MRRARSVAATLLAGLLLTGGPAPAYADEPAVTETVLTVAGTPEPDGTPVELDVTLWNADPGTPRPAVVLAHGFGGTKDDTADVARTLAAEGYVAITFTARGFGASGGLIHLNHPDFEGADARRIVDLAAQRPEVLQRDGDPVVGFAGASYGGALSLLVAGLDPRVDAVVPAFTWHRLDQALFPQYRVDGPARTLADVTPASGTGVFKQGWASRLFTSGGPPVAGGDPLCGRFTAELCAGYRRAAETGRPSPALAALLAESGPHAVLGDIAAPTLIIAGEDDTLFPLDQADANLRGLPAGTPAQLRWVAGGHDGDLSVDALLDDLRGWFDRHLVGGDTSAGDPASSTDPGFSVLIPETPLVGEGGVRDPETRVAAAYPGRGAELGTRRLNLTGDRQTVVAPPGGSPAALTNLPGSGGVLGGAAAAAGYALGVLPGQAATFTTEPVADPVPVVGSGRVDLEVTSSATSATLFVSLWDLGPDVDTTIAGRTVTGPSSAVLPHRTVAPVQLTGLTPDRPTRVTVALPAVAHQVPVEHRLRVVVSTTDQAYALPEQSAVYGIALAGDPVLVLPDAVLEVLGGDDLNVPVPLIVAVSVLVLAAVAGMIALGRRQRAARPDPALAHVPLAVSDVVKTYSDGFRAVDGVSFRAETGQVVGLLGPNGAGKTTAMRMLVGLIRPDAGQIFVHGQPVHAGADVLASVGSFIEGPGFLPHLTGRQNLDAYWAATGRPLEEAQLEEALAIAGLGAALDRRVRGYSQGMRQRLGIAQAMLGLPSLLVLDEPTNGLDPPQIKAMRQVLADYAAAGRTVVISSHLLGEVEQTCSHVVVMNRGRVVLTGSVSALTAGDSVTMIGLADGQDLAAAERHLGARGIAAVRAGDMLRVDGGPPRADLVRELVEAGYRIDSVDGRRQLEEIFLGLVGSAPIPTVGAVAEAATVNRRALPLRAEFGRQLRRRRTQGIFVVLTVLPLILVLAFWLGDSEGDSAGRGFVDLAQESGANLVVFALFASTGFLLVIVVALFAGDTVPVEASWSSLRYLLAAPVRRERLLRQKLVVAALSSVLALLYLPAWTLLVGGIAYGWGNLVGPTGEQVGWPTIAGRLVVIVAYLLVSLSVVGAAAFAIGVTTDAPLAAVGGAVVMMIICAILDSIPALGDLRQGLPGHYAYAWADALAANVDYSEMITGALWSIGYSILLVGFAFWHFLRKDITS